MSETNKAVSASYSRAKAEDVISVPREPSHTDKLEQQRAYILNIPLRVCLCKYY